MIATGIVIVLWLSFYLWYYFSYNHLIALKNTVTQSWSHIDVELQRRFDLIGNLIQVVKGYAQHEANTLIKTVHARRRQNTPSSTDPVQNGNLQNHQDAALLGNLMILIERYPDLKADQQFQGLQHELVDTENRIAQRRSAYNECVSRYQIYRQSFPNLLIAWAGHFDARAFFDADEEAAHAIKVVLS